MIHAENHIALLSPFFLMSPLPTAPKRTALPQLTDLLAAPHTSRPTRELHPDSGPFMVRQGFQQSELAWLCPMLGAFFPSMPRVMDVQNNGAQVMAMLGTAPGEPLKEYILRVGPLPVGVACALVWRLAAELEALEAWLPEVVRHLNPLACRAGVWQEEFLHLFVDRFEARPCAPEELPTRLLEVCAMLMNGRPGVNVTMAAMARVPVALLSHFREIERGQMTTLNIKQVKGIMLMTIANVTHGLKGSNMLAQLSLVPSLLPALPARREPPEIFGRATSSSNSAPYIRLSRLLAHRHSLGQGEIELLREALSKVAPDVPAAELSLDPQHILLRLPGQRDMAQTSRALDVRLDSVSGLSVMLESRLGCLSLGRSPIVIREAREPGITYTDIGADWQEQFNRLWQCLQDGAYGLSSYDLDSAKGLEMPGLFTCYLGDHLLRGTASYKPAQDEGNQPNPQPLTPTAAHESAINGKDLTTNFPFDLTPHTLPRRPMKMILITAGSGGTGKSTIARLLYELAGFEKRDDVALFDCDALGNRDFQKISPHKIESMPIDNVDTMRRIVESAMEGKLVLADLPASCQDVLARDLNPDIIESLRVDDGLHWMPIHPVTSKAASLPAIKQWRAAVFGDAPSIIVVSLKDGPVSPETLDDIIRPQDIVLKMPVLDQSLAAALDASNATWEAILEGRVADSHRMFGNPLVKRQLRLKLKECGRGPLPHPPPHPQRSGECGLNATRDMTVAAKYRKP